MYWFSYFSFLKLINALKVLLSYLLSIWFRRAFLWGKPLSLTVEPTNFCNLQCPECPTGNNTIKRDKGFLNISDYTKIIDTLSPWLLYHMIYFQGEPLLHPDISSMIHYAHQKNIYTCTSTNGHFLTYDNALKIIDSGLDKIIISVDGVTQETYEKYRKEGSLKKVISGIQNLAELKKIKKSKTPEIVIQFLVFRFNEHQISDIKNLGKSLGVNKVEIKSAQIDPDQINSDLLPKNQKFSRYNTNNQQIKIKNKLKNRCFRIWSTMVITWDGKIIPCCFDKNARHNIGNLNQDNILALWYSKEFTKFRKQILKNRKKIEICRNCTSGLQIKS